MGWTDAARCFARLAQRLAAPKFLAGCLLVNEPRRRRDDHVIDAEGVAFEEPALVTIYLDLANHRKEAINRRRDRMRNAEHGSEPFARQR
jgi:hypothetical protein